jgi:two-component system phosphate regulon sensor histidine kinase PhoR
VARRSLITEILLSLLLVVLVALAAATWNAVHAMRRFHRDETASTLETRARLVERDLQGKLGGFDSSDIEGLCKELGKVSATRVTVILPSGKVIGDSDEDPARMDSHGDRPEVIAALEGRIGQATRHSYTLHAELMYVAIPMYEQNRLVAIVRTSVPMASIDQMLNRVLLRVASGAAIVSVVAVALSIFLARRIVRPLRVIEAGARRFAQGDFDARLPMAGTAELSELALAMNLMAAQLRDRIQAMERQREELDAVLSSMAESVVAVDGRERVVLLNRAGARLFGVTIESARGRPIQEVIRNPKLQQCIALMLANGRPFEDEVVVVDTAEHSLHISASPLRDERGGQIGALLTLNDVTELRRLERARSDFVANVSHEIRTPVTLIKGYAETLLGETPPEPETTAHFLETILRQADRLCGLVDDTLSLAGLERSEVTGDVPREKTGLRGVVDAAVNLFGAKAREKDLRIQVSCPQDLEVQGQAFLLEQALINLLDNAIKYSDSGGEVHVEVERVNGEVEIRVRDTGQGIAQEHLPRIFERFYRIDKARSRGLGGTGLGLAIVKHIMNLHGGRVTVESTLGKGSCFTLHLPV